MNEIMVAVCRSAWFFMIDDTNCLVAPAVSGAPPPRAHHRSRINHEYGSMARRARACGLLQRRHSEDCQSVRAIYHDFTKYSQEVNHPPAHTDLQEGRFCEVMQCRCPLTCARACIEHWGLPALRYWLPIHVRCVSPMEQGRLMMVPPSSTVSIPVAVSLRNLRIRCEFGRLQDVVECAYCTQSTELALRYSVRAAIAPMMQWDTDTTNLDADEWWSKSR